MSIDKAGLLAPRSSYSLRLPIVVTVAEPLRGTLEAFVARYSGATARELHPFPYSPPGYPEALFRVIKIYRCRGPLV